MLKSTIKKIKDIDFNHTLKLETLGMDPQVYQSHLDRINVIFAGASDEIKAQQLHNIVIRDNLFSLAMDQIVPCYEVMYDDEDVKMVASNVVKIYGEAKAQHASEIAKRIILKSLIFSEIQKQFDIKITDEELLGILQDYYEKTNQPIRDFMEDRKKFEDARHTLLEEKTTAFIIEKFPKDLSVIEAKMQELAKEYQDNHPKQSKK